MPHRIFICYRKADTGKDARQLRLALDSVYGAGSTFLDEASIQGGETWPERLREALGAADVILILIGPDWLLSPADKWGRRRLDQDDDWVRAEIESALANRKTKLVLPILLGIPLEDTARDVCEFITSLRSLKLL